MNNKVVGEVVLHSGTLMVDINIHLFITIFSKSILSLSFYCTVIRYRITLISTGWCNSLTQWSHWDSPLCSLKAVWRTRVINPRVGCYIFHINVNGVLFIPSQVPVEFSIRINTHSGSPIYTSIIGIWNYFHRLISINSVSSLQSLPEPTSRNNLSFSSLELIVARSNPILLQNSLAASWVLFQRKQIINFELYPAFVSFLNCITGWLYSQKCFPSNSVTKDNPSIVSALTKIRE